MVKTLWISVNLLKIWTTVKDLKGGFFVIELKWSTGSLRKKLDEMVSLLEKKCHLYTQKAGRIMI